MYSSVITSTGSCIPGEIISNADFFRHTFYTDKGHPLDSTSPEVVEKFRQLTGISERRYAADHVKASDLASLAAKNALENSSTGPETIDQIIVAHNFGDNTKDVISMNTVPSLANRVKNQLGITNPACIGYDLLFGCAGWIQGVIHADAFFRAGIAKKCLVIGAETLSRVIDIYDRDSMIFSDGAGACVIEYKEVQDGGSGVLSSVTQSHSMDEMHYINMNASNNQESDQRAHFIKMKGRKVYEFAIAHLPAMMKDCLDKTGLGIDAVKKVFIHQTNEKLDNAVTSAFYKMYGIDTPPEHIMPMTIQWLGNSSVATLPTLYDLVRKNKMDNHRLHPGDIILFVSVGAGMNVNAMCYRY